MEGEHIKMSIHPILQQPAGGQLHPECAKGILEQMNLP